MLISLMLASALLTSSTSSAITATTVISQSSTTTARTVGDDDERRIALSRPSRGAYASAIRAAATVPVKHRAWAECVLRRESGGVLHNKQSREDARNSSSTAAGRWQFLAAWQHGGSFMVRDRLVKFGVPKSNAKRVRQFLGARPIYEWDGFWQDVLFNEVIDRGGHHHWAGGNYSC